MDSTGTAARCTWVRRWLKGAADCFTHPDLRTSWGGPFNGQDRRRELVTSLFAEVDFGSVVETGTYRGTTTDWLRKATGLPVHTIEVDPEYLGFARTRFLFRRGITVHGGDSRQVLRRLVASRSLKWPVFFYLDAHWGPDLPLAEELALILDSRGPAIVMIDDFMVPGDVGYKFDDYGPGKALTPDYIRPTVSEQAASVFVPVTPSGDETGKRRGCVVLTAEPSMREALRRLEGLRELAGFE